MDIKSKVALITGGAHRVGKAMALGLAKEDVKLALHYNQSEHAAQETLSEIQSLGKKAILIQGDFSKVDQIEKVVNTCYEYYQSIDILINNAAVYFKTPLLETSEEQWDELFNINLRAPYFCSQVAAQMMKKQNSGKIINIADVAGISPWPDYIPYSATKAGLISITKGMAIALAPQIQVNAIASGTVLMTENATSDYTNKIKDETLLKKIGSPQDIVNTVIFLLKGSDYLTGEVIVVDGGRLLA